MSDHLNDDQNARADALRIAGDLLRRRPSPLAGGGGLDPDWDTSDLTDLAQYVLEGTHPLAAYREESMTPIVKADTTGTTQIADGNPLVGTITANTITANTTLSAAPVNRVLARMGRMTAPSKITDENGDDWERVRVLDAEPGVAWYRPLDRDHTFLHRLEWVDAQWGPVTDGDA